MLRSLSCHRVKHNKNFLDQDPDLVCQFLLKYFPVNLGWSFLSLDQLRGCWVRGITFANTVYCDDLHK